MIYAYNEKLLNNQKLLTDATTGTILKIIMLGKRSNMQKSAYSIITFVLNSEQAKLKMMKKIRSVVDLSRTEWEGV